MSLNSLSSGLQQLNNSACFPEAMRAYSKSLKEYGRGIAGGLLFSLPMLYTMEVWWRGFTAPMESLLVLLFGTFLLLLGYNRYAGMRKDANFREVIIDSLEELGLGFILSFFILWLINRIVPGDVHHSELVGKVVIEAMSVAIGISIGTAQLGDSDSKEDSGTSREGNNKKHNDWKSQGVLSACGAVLIGANLGPTEEIITIAADITELQTLGLVIVSIVLTMLIMFYIDFANAREVRGSHKILKVIGSSFYTYSIAVFAAVLIAWFFGHLSGNAFLVNIKIMVVLGVATSLGASAGRLLLKGDG